MKDNITLGDPTVDVRVDGRKIPFAVLEKDIEYRNSIQSLTMTFDIDGVLFTSIAWTESEKRALMAFGSKLNKSS